jgi:inorganic pyrophosphatase
MDAIIAKEEPETVSGTKVNTKKSQIFKAAVTGDTVGDPLKDTSGPALNILMKLMAIISVVFAPLFLAVNEGGGLIAYLVPTTTAMAMPTTGLLALGVPAVTHNPSSLFAATIFLAGALVGMGGLFVTQRINAPPRSMVLRPSLQKPLLVAKVENVEGTEAASLRHTYSAPTA